MKETVELAKLFLCFVSTSKVLGFSGYRGGAGLEAIGFRVLGFQGLGF